VDCAGVAMACRTAWFRFSKQKPKPSSPAAQPNESNTNKSKIQLSNSVVNMDLLL
jgi:hypothetical protein